MLNQSNYVKFLLYRTKFICVCAPGKHILLYSISYIDRDQSKKPDPEYGISWNPLYDATNNCTNSHMSLSHQSVLVEGMGIPIFV